MNHVRHAIGLRPRPVLASLVLIAGVGMPFAAATAQDAPATAEPEPAAELLTLDVATCLSDGVRLLLQMQESLETVEPADPETDDEADGPAAAEWPYQGVYRVRGRIPIGYRVGGTSICATALLEAPGWREDADRRDAIHRAAAFVCEQTAHPLMQYPYPPAYDVRGWGYTYGLDFLLRLQAEGPLPAELITRVDQAIDFYLAGILETEISDGGWNYALSPRRMNQAPFMTAPVLQSLFRAVDAGLDVPPAVIERGLASLDASRLADGAMVYSGRASERSRDRVPGATGRMLAAEATLVLAGRGDPDRLRTAVNAFFEHWNELEKRRRQTGTHVPPYGVAPYYFFYAHHAVSMAIELLPEDERPAARARLHDRLATVREDDGTWNDRVFERSANYGTAMTMLALAMPQTATPPRWTAPKAAADAAAPAAPPVTTNSRGGDNRENDATAPNPTTR